MNSFLRHLLYTLSGIFVVIVIFLLLPMNDTSESSEGARMGRTCGGLAGRECPAGFECVYPEPMYPDAMGTCEAGLGGETQQSLYSFANKVIGTAIEIKVWVRSTLSSISQKLNPTEPPSRGPAY